ncbi:hypothetical protein LCGC14_1618350 [marine sediment metagenome]|uniref:Uncharacterized protein n=1 Tax=marine sediment metagenome TaxID=412755 RepID=A0A0F9IT41_9ZZZZ
MNLDRQMKRFCSKCKWCNLPCGFSMSRMFGLGRVGGKNVNNKYPGCVMEGPDCGYYNTCEGSNSCLSEYKRLKKAEDFK